MLDFFYDSFSEVDELNLIALENHRKLNNARIMHPETIFPSLFGFLFKPIPFKENGSKFLNVLSLESLWFYFLMIIFAADIFRNYLPAAGTNRITLYFVSSFIVIFTTISIFVEVNLGTAIRHKSMILLAMAIYWSSGKMREITK